MINVELKGGVVKEFEANTTAADVAKSLGAGLYKACCACKIDGVLCDLSKEDLNILASGISRFFKISF